MSHQVDPEAIWEAAQAQQHPEAPFLLYARDGASKVAHVVVEAGQRKDMLACTGFGRALVRDIANNPQLTLLWPAATNDALSLLADGHGEIIDDVLLITVESAVFHRPAPVEGIETCG